MCLLLPDFGFYVSLITAWQLNVSYGHLVGLGRVFNRFADNPSFLTFLNIPETPPPPLYTRSWESPQSNLIAFPAHQVLCKVRVRGIE